ncbi:hypothetical protein FPZ54_19480 [Sphingomonas suaedae]|uniref:DUF4760 domain-containing protein n=1 Tax=Sphingomonas suaedae TaxID=2599297 RepID=A0A518RKK6_9SPHN|nr:hypothetical protein [Sphingomonas suaedae]QDX27978.1 hypothetical protein FPZ54_19480 [Sphingomonas suaedae]
MSASSVAVIAALVTAVAAAGSLIVLIFQQRRAIKIGRAEFIHDINENLERYASIRVLIMKGADFTKIGEEQLVALRDYAIIFESIYAFYRAGAFEARDVLSFFGERFKELYFSEGFSKLIGREGRDNSRPEFLDMASEFRAMNELIRSIDEKLIREESLEAVNNG